MTRILVTGATGNVGAHVVRELRQRRGQVRAFVRDPDRAASRLGPDVELALGDFDDPPSLRRAMHGVDRVFLASANGPRQLAHETAVIDAASAGWVQRVVKLSALGAEIGSPMTFFDVHARAEQQLRSSGVPSVVLRPAFAMSNLFASADSVRAAGQIYAAAADAKIAMIDPRDVAAVAAAALLADSLPAVGCDGLRTHVLTGPEPLTYYDVATTLTKELGRDVTFVNVPDEAARAALLDTGAPAWLADSIVTVFGMLRTGLAADPTGSVFALTGRPPRTFAEFAHDHREVFAG